MATQGQEIPPSAFGISCFVKEDGLLHCERKLLPQGARGEPEGSARDPQRGTRASRQDGGFQRDAAMQRALAARAAAGTREPSSAEASGQLDYPEDHAAAGGSLIQGSARPPPDFGREWREGRAAPGASAGGVQAAEARPAAAVPRVSSLMYSS
jgi:hypothetical protein